MSDLKQILIVDDMPTNLKYAMDILGGKYRVAPAKSGEIALRFLENNRPALILLDIKMPDMDGYETLEHIKANSKTAGIPVIFLTADNDTESEIKGFKLGAVDFITKPFKPEIMLSRIATQIELSEYRKSLEEKVQEKTEVIEKLQDVMSRIFAQLVEAREGTTGEDVEKTTKYFKIFFEEVRKHKEYAAQITDEYAKNLIKAVPLHDIGKIGIDDAVLRKTSSLTKEEYEYMKSHTILGARVFDKIISELSELGTDITKEMEFLNIAKNLAIGHHERWNGEGYPYGRSREEIPLECRILSIVDIYEALTSRRSYKEPFSHEKAMTIIMDGRGTFFEPGLVDIFIDISDAMEECLMQMKEENQ